MGELYRTDLALWSAQQADALRSAARGGSNAAVDWDNVAEEIESLGASERRRLASHIRTVIEHLMKLQASPAQDPRNGWRETVIRARADIGEVLDDNPSLRREVPDIVARQNSAVRRLVHDILENWGEPTTDLEGLIYNADQVLGRWFPGSET
jgi:hypothetical protein